MDIHIMYVYIYIYIYIFIYSYIHIFICVYICIYIYSYYTYMRVYIKVVVYDSILKYAIALYSLLSSIITHSSLLLSVTAYQL